MWKRITCRKKSSYPHEGCAQETHGEKTCIYSILVYCYFWGNRYKKYFLKNDLPAEVYHITGKALRADS